jgi:hypothetical protein
MHFIPHTLHQLIMTIICICARSRGAGTRDQRGASPRSMVVHECQVARMLTLLDQGKPRCIPPKSLSFMFKTLFIILDACALSL